MSETLPPEGASHEERQIGVCDPQGIRHRVWFKPSGPESNTTKCGRTWGVEGHRLLGWTRGQWPKEARRCAECFKETEANAPRTFRLVVDPPRFRMAMEEIADVTHFNPDGVTLNAKGILWLIERCVRVTEDSG